jgi:hypothetical protein
MVRPAWWIGVLLAASSSTVFAAPRLAALTPALKPAAAPELRDRFHEAATRGIGQAGVEVVPAGEVRMRLAVSEEQLNCAGGGICAARAALTLRSEHLVATEIGITGKTYAIHVRMLDAAGREVAKVDDTCDICTLKEADDAVARAVNKLVTSNRAALEPTPVVEAPKPVPPPTEQPKPVAPPAPTPPPVAATPPAPTPAPVAATTPPKPDTKRVPWRWIGVGTVVGGVVFLSIGAGVASIDGKPTCGGPDPIHTCKSVYSTAAGGGIMIALGLASLGTSAAMFYMDWKSRQPAKTTWAPVLAPVQNGAMAGAVGRF